MPVETLYVPIVGACTVLAGAFYALVHVLGTRIGDLTDSLTARIANVEARLRRLESRIDDLHDVVAETNQRLTRLAERR